MQPRSFRALIAVSILTALCVSAFAEDPKYDVRVLRDTWGIPHVFGKTDPDTAYGLAYAHCEDDFKTIQEAFIAGRALGGVNGGPDAAAIDYVVHLLGVWDLVNAKYDTDLSPETRALCEAYAAGVNRYAEQHPDQVIMPEVMPMTGKDVVAGFVFKGPFFFGLDNAILELFGDERKREISLKRAALDFDDAEAFALAGDFLRKGEEIGSNTIGVSNKRSADGGTYLAINSHQPYTGPVAWYEAHLVSEDGWDMYGGLFPGMPVIAHGHNRHLGWAHTVNGPDLVDVYVLEMNPDNPDQYKFDGKWLDLEKKEVTLKAKLSESSKMTMNVRREVLRSVHGPVVRAKHGVYAIRYAGMGDIRQVEQWYRMNKAKSMDEWMDAVRMQANASLNIGYADDKGNILYLYNAKMPLRVAGYDYRQYLPGDTSELVWDEFLPFDDLPMVLNPPSGFFQNCNATPFHATVGPGNPDPETFAPEMGIEKHQSNRSLRALELFSADESITWDEFLNYKYDMHYSKDSTMAQSIAALVAYADANPSAVDKDAIALLRGWNLECRPDSTAAALAVMTVNGLVKGFNDGVPTGEALAKQLSATMDQLKTHFGRIDPPWSEVNRVVHGPADHGIGGGPDILHAVYGKKDEATGRLHGQAGDTLVIMARWDKAGQVHSEAIHQFGSATSIESSPHYADQVPLFVERKLRPVWLDEAEIRKNLEREYRPGQE